MPDKTLAYAQMAEETAKQITGSYQRWTAFLTTAARVYKYPYTEQLLIYAQRPDATACAEYGLWTNTMRRYVRRGSKGIALIDTSGETPRIRYVFDISDTGGREDSRRLNPWSLNDDNMDAVLDSLHNQYEINAASIPDLLETIATQLSTQYWEENQRDILDIVDGSFLEEYDEYNVGAAFRQAASVSITYMLMSRCGLEPETHFSHEDFMSIFDFNTPETVAALGTAVSQISQTVLRQIEVTIRNAERRMEYERNDEQPDLSADGGRAAAQRGPGRDGNGAALGQVRQDAEEVPEGASPSAVQQPDRNGKIADAPAGDRGDSPAPSGSDDGRNAEESGPIRANEIRESDEMGGPDERPESSGRGNPDGGVDLQLKDTQPERSVQEETEQPIAESAEENEPSAFSVSRQEEVGQAVFDFPEMQTEQQSFFGSSEQPAAPVQPSVPHAYTSLQYPPEVVDTAISIGANDRNSRLKICAFFMKDKSVEENAEFLKNHYGTNGAGFYIDDRPYAIWYNAEGLRLSMGTSALGEGSRLYLWEQVAVLIRRLLDEGRYLPQYDLEMVPEFERREIGAAMLHLHQDVDNDAESTNYLPALGAIANSPDGFPGTENMLAEMLSQPDAVRILAEEMEEFTAAYAQNRNLLRFHYHRPQQVLTRLRDLQREQLTFTAAPDFDPQRKFFISDDEIDRLLLGRTDDHEYRLGVYSFFLSHSETKDREEYMKGVHGDYSGSYSGSSNILYTRKGIEFSHGTIGSPYAEVKLTWNTAVRRIEKMIEKNAFLSDTDRSAMPEYERKHVAQAVVNGLRDAPDYIPRPYTGNTFTDYWENVQQVQAQLTDPSRVEAIIASLVQVMDMTLPNDRDYPSRQQAVQTVEAYRDGTYTLFGEKREPAVVQNGSTLESANESELTESSSELEQEAKEQETPPPSHKTKPAENYKLGFDHIGNGLTVWNSLEYEQGDYKTVAHIAADRTVKFYDDEMPDSVRKIIIEEAETANLTISATQNDPVFSTPPRDRTLKPPTQEAQTQPEQPPVNADGKASQPLAVSEEHAEAFSPRKIAQDDIDEALRAWNGSMDSKRAVVRYMREHGRERGTAAWLRHEYDGDDLPAFPVTVEGAAGDISWTRVQRGIARLIDQDRFFTDEEQDRFEEIDPAYIRERLAQNGIVGGEIVDREAFDRSPMNRELDALVAAVQSSERNEADEPATALEEQPAAPRMMETVVELTENGYQVIETRPVREYRYDCMYHDIAYLDGQAYQVEKIGLFDVTFQPLEMENLYPVARVESRERLETLLAQDERNSHLLSAATLEQRQQAQVEWREKGNQSDPEATNATPVPSEPMQQGMPKAQNFRITDIHLGEGGAKTKFKNNMAAIYTLKTLEAEERPATLEEQEILSQYVGWGGLANAFDPDKRDWSGEYKELEAALTPEEYAAARASTLNAHYTSPTVIRAIYEALGKIGFQKGNILEPAMGVGNFFGMLPESMRESRLYGVELDSITGRIAKQLYPQADITVAGFETTDRRDFFDLAVGNVPFGNYKVNDRAYNKLGFNIHNYFFAKTLDQVRPGGIVAFITSRYTMDSKSPEVRKYLAERAELLGAIRLPSNAFTANAGTEVTTDIIFLQKRDSPMVTEPDWVHLGETTDGVPVNSYYVEHPEMVLGTMVWDDKMHGYEKETACQPIPGADLGQQLSEAITHIQGQYQEAELPELEEGEEIEDSLPADPNVANFSYTVVEGKVYYREDSIMVRPKLSQTAQERTAGMVEIRDCVHQLMDAQLTDAPDQDIQALQARLNTLYDAYTAKYGLINSRGNAQAFSADSSYYLLCSLEVLDENGNLERKADMFTKRTIRQQRVVDHVDTAVEALALSISERAKVDLPYMAHLTEKSEEDIINDLTGVIFRLPEPAGKDGRSKYVTADEYLSGNVRQKLQKAQSWAESDESFQVNVKALEAVQPKDLSASEIDVRLGATWIDKKYIRQFMYETFHTPVYKMWNDLPYATNRHAITVNFSPVSAEWNISNKSEVSYNDVTANTTFGTSCVNAYEILEATLNLRDVRIFDTVKDAEGKEKRVLNQKETTLAQQKQQAIKDAFRDWIWKDPDRREDLVHVYNEKFNSTRPREYDGSHISFAGMNPEIELRSHQRNAIAHILYGGNTLLAHQVGAGKTFEMAAAIMESKRLGLCNKAILVVPNHLTEQWSSEFLRLYPTAKLLVTTKKDFEKKNRKKFCARIATGDYDAVIIGHSQFEKIPISYTRQERMLQEQIRQIVEGIEELKYERGERFSIKQMERTKKGLEARLAKLRADHKKDDVVTFEQLGVDRLYVDESHSFKNLFVYTKMSNVAGLSTAEAQKSNDMFLKCRYMDEITDGKGIVFATGTPISNSMVEMYTIQRYLQYETLKQQNMTHFDCWASTFGETVTALELAPEGTGYRARTRFAKFFNLPELMSMFKEVADVKTADQLNLPTPEAHYETIAVKPSDIQKSLIQSLSERAAAVHAHIVDPSLDNMLKIVRC